MGTINLVAPSPGEDVDAGPIATAFAAIQAVLNGNIDAANIADGSITVAKLAAGVASVPTGSLFAYAGTGAPAGYLLCDGTAVSRSTYAALFTAISTSYGAGDGSLTFNLPDLRGRVPVGKGTNAAVDTLGENDGIAEASRAPRATLSADLSSTGDNNNNGGAAVQTVGPPYQVVNYIIKT